MRPHTTSAVASAGRGQGLPPVGLALTCRSCFGLGKVLVPKVDPKKAIR